MKKNHPIVVLFLFSSIVLNAQSSSWIQKSGLSNILRAAPTGFSIGNKGYVLTGLNTSGAALSDLWQWNSVTNVWTQKANLPGSARYAAVSFVLNGKGYITTGWSTSPSIQLNDLWEYDPTINTWNSKTNFGGSGRYTACAFVVSGNAYVGMGYAPLQNDLWKYNQGSNSWTQQANLPSTSRQGSSGFGIGSYGYVACGNNGSNLSELWRFDPSSNTWLQRANFPGTARYACGSFVLNGKGYLGTGGTSSVYFTDFYKYDPSADKWTPAATFAGAGRRHSAFFSINGKGYICCGSNASGNLNDLWEYDPNALFSYISATNISCNGGNSGSATLVVSGGTTPYQYAWNTGSNSSILLNLSAGTYTATVTDAAGASVIASVTITQPVILSSTSPSVAPICKGSGTSINVTVTGGTPIYSYSWSPSAGLSASIAVSPSATTNYSVYVTDANGCTTSNSVSVIVNPLPGAPIQVNNGGTTCAPDSIKLSSSTNPTHFWQWFKNGVSISGANDSIYYSKITGTYKVLVTNANGCTKYSTTVSVNITQLPVAITPTGTVSICQGDSTLLTAVPSTGYGYQWRRNSVDISGATQSGYYAKQVGTYKVQLTAFGSGCTGLSAGTSVLIPCRNLFEVGLNSVFPNPTSNFFSLDLSAIHETTVDMTLSDISGRVIKEYIVKKSVNDIFTFGDDLLQGVYFVKFSYEGNIKIIKLVKANN